MAGVLGHPTAGAAADLRRAPRRRWGRIDWPAYGWAAAVVGLATGAAWLMFGRLELANLVMVYLLGIVVVAVRHGRGPSLVASLLAVTAFNFFFVPPYYTLTVADAHYLLTFLVMFVVALVIGSLTVRLRAQAQAAREREQHTAALYAMSRDLAGTRRVEDLIRIAARHIGEVFDATVAIAMPDAEGRLPAPEAAGPEAADLARQAHALQQAVGLGTPRAGRAGALYLPLLGSRGAVGVMAVRPADRHRLGLPEQVRQLETFANQTALALERARLAEEAEEARVRAETERLRNALLSSVSHDLRTPLAAIVGAASAVLEGGDRLDPATRRELLESVRDEGERLGRLVQNLLQMTRLESGAVQVRKEWHAIEEVIGAALGRVEKRLAGRRVHTRVPPDLPLAPMDDVLIEQVLVNLLDNALKHTPPGTPISVTAAATDQGVSVEVADRGPGLSPEEEGRITASRRGSGLGLAICESIVRLHGGRIWAHNLPEGGCAFFFSLPRGESPPAVVSDE